MKPEQENFDQLSRFLKLKRYEQPHPRYFNNFSSQVIARIRAGEAGGLEAPMWLIKLWSLFEARPALPGAVGAAACALLVLGAVYSESSPSLPGPGIADTQPGSLAAFAVSPADTAAITSTNLIPLGGSLFDRVGFDPARASGRNPLIPFNSN